MFKGILETGRWNGKGQRRWRSASRTPNSFFMNRFSIHEDAETEP